VGGAVRDLTYGQQTIRDLDFAVEGDPRKILRHLTPAYSAHAAPPGARPSPQVQHIHFDKHLRSAELNFAQGVDAEIGMSRAEIYARPGRRPQIAPALIFDDLKRRDFSVDAMAVSLHLNSRGLLLDPTNGASDIEKRELRVLHSRSFQEDPSRLYRLLRLGVRLGFKPEERTGNYLNAAFERELWERLEPEQQGRELRALLHEEDPGRALRLLAEKGLLGGLDRRLSPRKIPYELFKKIRAASPIVSEADPSLLNFHALVAKMGGAQRTRLARKIIRDRQACKFVLGIERAAKRLARTLGSGKAALPSRAYKLLTDQPPTLLLFLLVHYRQAKIQKRIKNFQRKARPLKAALPRAEFLAMGVKAGPKFEAILERLFLDQLDGRIKTHAQLLKEFRKLAGIPEPKPPKPSKPLAKPTPKTAQLAKPSFAAKPVTTPAMTVRKPKPATPKSKRR
jgi:tRNA nucleotidyltransferase (CCA-adding enzyme)